MLSFNRNRSMKWIKAQFDETTEELNNPYRGMYSILRFNIASSLTIDGYDTEDIVIPKNQNLVLVEINLKEFNSSRLPESAILNVDEILTKLESKNVGIILRFAYDLEGCGAVSEPEEIDIILEHMSQLKQVLFKHANNIYILQGLMIGSWGEMHNTRYDSVRDIRALMNAFEKCTPPQSFLAVRCPNIWRMIYRTMSPAIDIKSSDRNRCGLYNDAILASDTDLGTYGTVNRATADRWDEKFTRVDELAFQQNLCLSVPNGGEVVNDSELNDVENAIFTLKTMHISYLNSSYDEKVLDKWKMAEYSLKKSIWYGKSGYDYISAHLGYRFIIDKVKPVFKKDSIELNISIKNKGFSSYYRECDVKLVLFSKNEIIDLDVNTDVRLWHDKETFSVSIDSKNLKANSYKVGLKVCDKLTGAQIRFANTQSIPECDVYNYLGEILL